jgi:hypothetical protein
MKFSADLSIRSWVCGIVNEKSWNPRPQSLFYLEQVLIETYGSPHDDLAVWVVKLAVHVRVQHTGVVQLLSPWTLICQREEGTVWPVDGLPLGTRISEPSWYFQSLRKDKAPLAENLLAAAIRSAKWLTLVPVVG